MPRYRVVVMFTQTVEADTAEEAEEQVGEYIEGASVGYGPDGMEVTSSVREVITE